MRNLSFSLTTRQMRDRTKTVTRRRGTWWASVLKPGDLVCAVEKSQGIKKGGLVRLGTIRIVSVTVEPLSCIAFCTTDGRTPPRDGETVREGFPEMSPVDFMFMFMRHMGGTGDSLVTRIEFEHVGPARGEINQLDRRP